MSPTPERSDERDAPAADPTSDAILDAARACVLDFGFRRTTLSDVARRAGVSRVTVYRRYPDLDAVVRDLMTREFGALMEDVEAGVDGADSRARAVAATTATTRALREHPVMRKVLEAEPELLLPYVLGRLGGTHVHAAELIVATIVAGQQDGSVRAGDPAVLARTVLLTAQAFLLWGTPGDGAEEDLLLAELAHTIDASLRPD